MCNTDNETEAKDPRLDNQKEKKKQKSLYKTLEQQGLHLKAYRSVQWPET